MSNAVLTPAFDNTFIMGANQFIFNQNLAAGYYESGENVMCRGGLIQPRPGTNSILTLPDGLFQGLTLFKPASGIPYLLAAVSGKIYASAYPFTEFSQLSGFQFSETAANIAWATCLKSTDYTVDGELYFLDNPYSVLMIQDGFTRCGVWDGITAKHLNPTPSGGTVTQPDRDGTPIGLWMIWANNRLWVSRGNQVFASDIGNPEKFTEAQYLNEGRAFYLPDVCTGIAATTDNQGIVCFTEQTGTFIQSSIQDRTQWLATPEFQKDILPNVGCVAPRSIVSQYGTLWWYSARGLINQDDALKANITSRLDVKDQAMAGTKANMSFDLSGICSSSYENMILASVPWGDRYNRRTMVLDQAPMGLDGSNVNAWAGYWTGWRPIEWASGVINGEERVFFGSVDYDGKNRIWELGAERREDNGTPITWHFVTRAHNFGHLDYKVFNYADMDIVGLRGKASVMAAVSGVRGGWQKILSKDMVATRGQVYFDSEYGEGGHVLAGSRAQTRYVRTQSASTVNECNSVCVESDTVSGFIDKAFSLLIMGSGEFGVSAVRLIASNYPNVFNGTCENNEEGFRLLNDFGCGSRDGFITTNPFETYTATETFSAVDECSGKEFTATETATSIISQTDAKNKSLAAAKAKVQSLIDQEGCLIEVEE